ncbi:MAG: translation initiation factor IF-6 [Candidatus Micrarchaeaceae archaeon]
MGIIKTEIRGSDYIGAFGIATDEFTLIGNVLSESKKELLNKALETPVITASVDGSYLLGVYAVANSKGILLQRGASDKELKYIKTEVNAINGAQVARLDSDLNALGNNISANNKTAFVNPGYSSKETKIIADMLDVEVIKMRIAGYSTIGAVSVFTNRGIAITDRSSEAEKAKIEAAAKLPVDYATANFGSTYLGLAVLANSKGMIIGSSTSGFELARISNALGLE